MGEALLHSTLNVSVAQPVQRPTMQWSENSVPRGAESNDVPGARHRECWVKEYLNEVGSSVCRVESRGTQPNAREPRSAA